LLIFLFISAETPLQITASHGRIDICELLLFPKANVNAEALEYNSNLCPFVLKHVADYLLHQPMHPPYTLIASVFASCCCLTELTPTRQKMSGMHTAKSETVIRTGQIITYLCTSFSETNHHRLPVPLGTNEPFYTSPPIMTTLKCAKS
jgi:hypothetical protein